VDVKVVKKSDHHVSPMTVVQEGDGSRRVAMTPMRKVIARRMTESYFEVPAVHIDNEVDMTKLLDLRQELIPTIEEETGYRVSVGDLISMATVKSLMKHPAVNASIDLEKQEIIYHDYVNLAIAVGLENGLLTPVINQADQLSLKQYVTAAKPLFKAATEGKLSADQLQGSTFTISNLGMFDTDSFTPIINLPNAAILGVNATKKKVVVVDEEMVIRPIMKLSLTMDHRVLDGMEGAKFLQTLKGYLENPLSLIV
jgi:pyruvate dehydrogenase E2 component (dihydrolipoamide acetyltransferase)